MSVISPPTGWKNKLPAQAAAVLLGGSLIFFVCTALLSGVYQLVHAGAIIPGVSVAGVDLSGLDRAEAVHRLSQQLSYPQSGQVILRDGERLWVAAPAELGLVFDVEASATSAYEVGRGAGILGDLAAQGRSRWRSTDLPPVIRMDQRLAYAYLQGLAAEIDVPVQEADLHLNGSEVVYLPGQNGRTLNVDASLAALVAQLRTFRDGEVVLLIHDQPPEVLDASAEAGILQQLLSAPLTLTLSAQFPGSPGAWVLDIPRLAAMVKISKVVAEEGTRLQVMLDPLLLRLQLEEIARQVDTQPENARFIFNDSTRGLDLLQSGISGRRLEVDAALPGLNDTLVQGGHAFTLQVVETPPVVGDGATAASLGITGLVSNQSTWFRGSSSERMQNIQTAGESFHGLLVAPGETFSMGNVLGDVSLENGYAEAMIIYNGRTIKGVGGGVCQVSTTLFRTAFFGGYPIPERTPHAYRVYYYEQNEFGYDSNLAGLDATVYVPLVDLKFTNDRSSWLLMEVYVNRSLRRITWKFYSGEDGRSIEWSTTGTLNIVPAPEPLLSESADIAANEIKQVDWSADGADVVVRRTVTLNGAALFSDSFPTHYEPWQAVCEYGTGTEDPLALAALQNVCQP